MNKGSERKNYKKIAVVYGGGNVNVQELKKKVLKQQQQQPHLNPTLALNASKAVMVTGNKFPASKVSKSKSNAKSQGKPISKPSKSPCSDVYPVSSHYNENLFSLEEGETNMATSTPDQTKNDEMESNVVVAVRARPLLPKELESDDIKPIIRVLDRKVVIVLDPGVDGDDVLRLNRSREKRYAFDYAFDEDSSQVEVYSCTVQRLLDGVLNGYNATAFAYGATGSGKTYTMLGTIENPGIIFLTMKGLFEKIDSVSDMRTYKITLSYIEVYNENIKDLLNTNTEYLDLREDHIKGIKVVGVTEINITNINEIMNLIRKGNKNRSQEPTSANEESSRSHAVLQIVLEHRQKTRNTTEILKVGKLSLIDLAGSERASVTQNRGVRLLEGANINRSLLALGNCINALGEKMNKGSYVPYRDSKLTRLLKDSLGGNCRTIMIANVSPSSYSLEDTTNTLKYANRAKNIKTTVTRNVNEVSHHIAQYTKIIAELRSEIAMLKQRLSEAPKDILNQEDRSEFSRLRKELIANFEERMQLGKSIIELDTLEHENRLQANTIQVEISKWQSENPGTSPNETPRTVNKYRKELSTLLQNMEKNAILKQQFQLSLVKLEEKANSIKEELQKRAVSSEMKETLQLLYRIHVLELENMEISACVNDHSLQLKEKDQEICKLRLQVQLRDDYISQQKEIIKSNHIEHANIPSFSLLKLDSKVPHENLNIPLTGILHNLENDQHMPPINKGTHTSPQPPTEKREITKLPSVNNHFQRSRSNTIEAPKRYQFTPNPPSIQTPNSKRTISNRPKIQRKSEKNQDYFSNSAEGLGKKVRIKAKVNDQSINYNHSVRQSSNQSINKGSNHKSILSKP